MADYLRMQERDPEVFKQLLGLRVDIAKLGAELKLPTPGQDRAARLMQASVEGVPSHLSEEAWHYATACPACGHVEFHYLTVYRRLVELIDWCLTMFNDPTSPFDEQVKEILQYSRDDPIFMAQLADLGMAWCQPLLDVMDDLTERNPPVPENEADSITECICISLDAEPEADAERRTWLVHREINDWLTYLRGKHAGVTRDDWAAPVAAFLGISPVNFDLGNPLTPVRRVQPTETGLAVVTPDA